MVIDSTNLDQFASPVLCGYCLEIFAEARTIKPVGCDRASCPTLRTFCGAPVKGRNATMLSSCSGQRVLSCLYAAMCPRMRSISRSSDPASLAARLPSDWARLRWVVWPRRTRRQPCRGSLVSAVRENQCKRQKYPELIGAPEKWTAPRWPSPAVRC